MAEPRRTNKTLYGLPQQPPVRARALGCFPLYLFQAIALMLLAVMALFSLPGVAKSARGHGSRWLVDISQLETYSLTDKRNYYINQLERLMESRLILADAPPSAENQLRQEAYELLQDGARRAGLTVLLKLLEQDPAHLVARWHVAELFLQFGQFEKALFHFDKLLDQAPLFSRGYLSRAQIWLKLKDFETAFSDFHLAMTTHNLLESDHLKAFAGAIESGARRADLTEVVISLNRARDLGDRISQQPEVHVDLLRNQQLLKETYSEWTALYGLDSAPETRGGQLLNDAFELVRQGEASAAFDLLFQADRSGIFSSRQASALEQRTYARLLAIAADWANRRSEILNFLQKGDIHHLSLTHRVVLAYATLTDGCAAQAEMTLLSPEGKLLDTKAVGPEEAAAYYLSLVDIAIHAGDEPRAKTAAHLLTQITRSPDFGLQLGKIALENAWELPTLHALRELITITSPADYLRQPQAWTTLLETMAALSVRTEELAQADELLDDAQTLVPGWQMAGKRGQVALYMGRIEDTASALQDALGHAREQRRTKPFTATQKADYARLYFDLASFSALHNDWRNTYLYLLRDWAVSKDPALIGPAYMLLTHSTAPRFDADLWFSVINTELRRMELSYEEQEAYAAHLLALARTLRNTSNFEGALQAYELALILWPTDLLSVEAADTALLNGDPSKALELVSHLKAQASPAAPITAILCEVNKRTGHEDTAIYCKPTLPASNL